MVTLLIEAESFNYLGGWTIDQQSVDQMGSPYIMAHGMGIPVEDARTSFSVSEEGMYKVWARTRDWAAVWNTPSSPGRFIAVIDDYPLENTLGINGTQWAWQLAGSVHLYAGEHRMALHDLTGFNGRCDALFISNNPDFIPSNSPVQVEALRREYGWKKIEDVAEHFDLILQR